MKKCKNCSNRFWRVPEGLLKKYWCFAYEFLTPEAKERNNKAKCMLPINFENFSLNREGTCTYYERLWYKFWVK